MRKQHNFITRGFLIKTEVDRCFKKNYSDRNDSCQADQHEVTSKPKGPRVRKYNK